MQGKIKFSVLGVLVLAVAAGGATYWYQQQKGNENNAVHV